jgi:hypothetical protein
MQTNMNAFPAVTKKGECKDNCQQEHGLEPAYPYRTRIDDGDDDGAVMMGRNPAA